MLLVFILFDRSKSLFFTGDFVNFSHGSDSLFLGLVPFVSHEVKISAIRHDHGVCIAFFVQLPSYMRSALSLMRKQPPTRRYSGASFYHGGLMVTVFVSVT